VTFSRVPAGMHSSNHRLWLAVTSITGFTQKFAGATVVSAGSLGGTAACSEEGPPRRAKCPSAPGSITTASGKSSHQR
jgi:hypothetical protein